jgi:hypothetical protein
MLLRPLGCSHIGFFVFMVRIVSDFHCTALQLAIPLRVVHDLEALSKYLDNRIDARIDDEYEPWAGVRSAIPGCC